MYWQQRTRVPAISDTMPRDRFFKIRNYLKVVDNNAVTDNETEADRLWKVRPFLEKIRKTCVALSREPDVSADEQMIAFTGRCPARQYVHRKPHPTGLKNFVLAGASGIVMDFEVYQGAHTFDNYELDGKKTGQGIGAVLCLVETLSIGHRLFCDRFFTTVPLILNLKEKGIMLTGTITKRCLPVTVPVSFTGDKHMSALGRGTCKQFVSSSDIAIVKWYDKKPILIASSAFGVEPQDTCRRWSKKDREHIEVNKPFLISKYNQSMGGVDLCDRMIAYH
ncbi:PREDICTED: piggyBac transposable element-derived protein 2-like [Priapulus caudatus]|uniref:PiggyBac transposable element-derived protein 2-like n=1 Tax=Priapulus caudatus TaxID=37621 RepID=A0ABM1ER02_PRICU|nr:PREDICTED: piggyBac transposable element-derived protein 2-like [Priapulus caudatus]